VKILIVTATHQEIDLLVKKNDLKTDKNGFVGNINNHQLKILVTGIGIPNTMFQLTRILENERFDFIIHGGIAGSFNNKIRLGEVVNVMYDCFADIGYEDDNDFVPFMKTDLLEKNKFPFTDGWLNNPTEMNQLNYKIVKGITVNMVHGNEKSIQIMQQIYHPDVETMEGAAVAFCCLQYHVNFLQLRAISNKVEKRNKENWNIPLAMKNLNNEIEQILKQI